MLALFPGIHGLSPRHAFSCPTALLPAGSYPRLVSVPKDKVGKATSEIHSDKSLFLNLKNTLPVLCHSLPVGFTLLLLSVRAGVQSCPWVLPCPLLQAELTRARGCVRADWDAKKQGRGRGESSAESHAICQPGFQFEVFKSIIQQFKPSLAGL